MESVLIVYFHNLIYCTICIADHSVYDHCTNIFGVTKLLLLKVVVGAIVVQGLIESALYSSGASPYESDDDYSAEQKALRAYCELSIVLSRVYGLFELCIDKFVQLVDMYQSAEFICVSYPSINVFQAPWC